MALQCVEVSGSIHTKFRGQIWMWLSFFFYDCYEHDRLKCIYKRQNFSSALRIPKNNKRIDFVT